MLYYLKFIGSAANSPLNTEPLSSSSSSVTAMPTIPINPPNKYALPDYQIKHSEVSFL